MRVGCSACLLGHNCKYNGSNNRNEALLRLLEGHEVIPVCPEVAGGLGCPRTPCEIQGERVVTEAGKDCTDEYIDGAKTELEKLKSSNVQLVILQPRSPSCGVHEVYDGTFSGKLIPGQGIFARMILEAGIPVMEAPSKPRTVY